MKRIASVGLKAVLGAVVLGLLPAASHAQSPEFRYWNRQAAQNWARSGLAARGGNVPGALYYQYRGARDTGRALYFGSRQWENQRGAIVRSPYWDAQRQYFRP